MARFLPQLAGQIAKTSQAGLLNVDREPPIEIRVAIAVREASPQENCLPTLAIASST